MSALLQGLLLGISIAVPVGPIGLLCLRRSLTAGRLAGFVSGLGAATADALFGVIAALGLTTVTSFLVAYQRPLQLAAARDSSCKRTSLSDLTPCNPASTARIRNAHQPGLPPGR